MLVNTSPFCAYVKEQLWKSEKGVKKETKGKCYRQCAASFLLAKKVENFNTTKNQCF